MKVYRIRIIDSDTLTEHFQEIESDSISHVMMEYEDLYPSSKVVFEVWPKR